MVSGEGRKAHVRPPVVPQHNFNRPPLRHGPARAQLAALRRLRQQASLEGSLGGTSGGAPTRRRRRGRGGRRLRQQAPAWRASGGAGLAWRQGPHEERRLGRRHRLAGLADAGEARVARGAPLRAGGCDRIRRAAEGARWAGDRASDPRGGEALVIMNASEGGRTDEGSDRE